MKSIPPHSSSSQHWVLDIKHKQMLMEANSQFQAAFDNCANHEYGVQVALPGLSLTNMQCLAQLAQALSIKVRSWEARLAWALSVKVRGWGSGWPRPRQ